MGNARAKVVAQDGNPHGPDETTDDIEEGERRVAHLPHAGQDRSKGPNDGHEAGQDDGLGAVTVKKNFRLVEVTFVEEDGIGPLEKSRADCPAKPVAEAIASNGAESTSEDDPGDLKIALGGEDPRGKKERITG